MTPDQRSRNLSGLLARRIAATGPLTVADFMMDALYHPAHGYYMTGDPIGAAGDFITAPEISQMFGELIGLWCADAWLQMGRPQPVALVELGPGRGTLLQDALRAIEQAAPACAAAAQVHLVETSPTLRRRQETLLGDRQPRPIWHSALDTVPELPALVIANELFDALPVRQFQRTEAGWCERLVDLADRPPAAADAGADVAAPAAATADPVEPPPGLRFVLDCKSAAAETLLPAAVRRAPLGSLVEICPAGWSLMESLAGRLMQAGGAALVIDYGYEGPRPGETLQAMRRHKPGAVLDSPGRSDLTAHVDFALLAERARGAGARVFGPVPQGRFLRRLGIEARAAALAAAASDAQKADIEAALTRLIDDEEMGTLFRVLSVTGRPGPTAPGGFDPLPADAS